MAESPLSIKVRLPGKKKMASIPEQLMKDALPWMLELGPKLMRELQERTRTRGRGAIPGGPEYPLAAYTQRYGRNRGSVDYFESGQLMDSMEPRIMWKDEELRLTVKPYGTRTKGRRLGRPPVFNRPAPKFQAGLSQDQIYRELEDQELVTSERIGSDGKGTSLDLAGQKVWVQPHERSGSQVEPGDIASKYLEAKTKSKLRYHRNQRAAKRTLAWGHDRSAHSVRGHWRSMPDNGIPLLGRKSIPYWTAWVRHQIEAYYYAKGTGEIQQQTELKNQTVADALGRRFGRGRWAKSGRPRPWLAISQAQMTKVRGLMESQVGRKVLAESFSMLSFIQGTE